MHAELWREPQHCSSFGLLESADEEIQQDRLNCEATGRMHAGNRSSLEMLSRTEEADLPAFKAAIASARMDTASS